MYSNEINMGYIMTSRKLLNSDIMKKPPNYLKVWIYLLLNATHKERGNLKRGQGFTSIPKIMDYCTYFVGASPRKPTKKEIFGIIEWLRNPHEGNNEGTTKGAMIETTKVTHGFVYNIVKYNVYQDPESYESNNEGNNEGITKVQRRASQGNNINKNDKNDNNDKKNNSSVGELFKFYDNNIQPLTEYITDKINSFLDDGVDDELMLRYFQIAVERKKCNWAYIQAIAQNNLNDGIKTVSQYEESERQFKGKQIIKINTNKVEQVNNFKQREYEKDEFEQFYSNK